MKIAAERDKDTLNITCHLRRLNITNPNDAVDLANNKDGEHSKVGANKARQQGERTGPGGKHGEAVVQPSAAHQAS